MNPNSLPRRSRRKLQAIIPDSDGDEDNGELAAQAEAADLNLATEYDAITSDPAAAIQSIVDEGLLPDTTLPLNVEDVSFCLLVLNVLCRSHSNKLRSVMQFMVSLIAMNRWDGFSGNHP